MDYVYGNKQVKLLKDSGWLQQLPLSAAEGEAYSTGIVTDAALASLKRNHYQPKKWQWVSHDEWAASHPGQCFEKPTFTWTGEALDPLGPKLFAVSEGTKWYPNQFKAARTMYGTDDAVVTAFVNFVKALPAPPFGKRAWKKAQGMFSRQCAEAVQQGALVL